MDLFGALTFLTAPIQSISIAPHNCQQQRRVLESDDAMHILLHRQAHVLEYSASFAWKRVHLFGLGYCGDSIPFRFQPPRQPLRSLHSFPVCTIHRITVFHCRPSMYAATGVTYMVTALAKKYNGVEDLIWALSSHS
jgi:hypothetical protein